MELPHPMISHPPTPCYLPISTFKISTPLTSSKLHKIRDSKKNIDHHPLLFLYTNSNILHSSQKNLTSLKFLLKKPTHTSNTHLLTSFSTFKIKKITTHIHKKRISWKHIQHTFQHFLHILFIPYISLLNS